MEETVINPVAIGKSIHDWGFMALATAFYLTYSALLFGFFIRWLVRVINSIINEQRQSLIEIERLLRKSLELQERSGKAPIY